MNNALKWASSSIVRANDFIHGIFSTKDENNLEICFGLKFGNWIFSVLFVHRGRLPSYIDNAYDVLSSPISKLFPGLIFSLTSSFQYCYLNRWYQLKFVIVWIWNADLLVLEATAPPLRHSHCPPLILLQRLPVHNSPVFWIL